MGDPKRHRKKYSTPSHPWQKERIVEEDELRKEYGVKNKKELWKLKSKLKNFATQAKKLTTLSGEQAEKEKQNLLNKIFKIGLTTESINLDEVLGIDIKALMERRLQTLLVRKGLSKTIKQARQFIVHGHVTVDGKLITSPNHIVLKEDESKIGFIQRSKLSDPEHPERTIKKKPEEIEVLAKKKDAEKAKEKEEAPKEEKKPAETKPAEEKKEESPKEEAPKEDAPKEEKKEEAKEE